MYNKVPFHDVACELSDKEMINIDIRAMGNMVHDRAFSLSRHVNEELLTPISQWLDDPDFLNKFEVNSDDHIPNWAAYKKRERQLNQQQKVLAAERLKLYWQEIHKKRNYRKELAAFFRSAHYQSCTDTQMHNNLDVAFVTDLVAPFSPVEQHRSKVALAFAHAVNSSVFNLLPWKLLITSDINAGIDNFSDLTLYYSKDPKADKVAKFQHLLQMANDREINLDQETNYGDIRITCLDSKPNTQIIIKDRAGNEIYRDWIDELSDAQRNKVIADAIDGKIICKTGWGDDV